MKLYTGQTVSWFRGTFRRRTKSDQGKWVWGPSTYDKVSARVVGSRGKRVVIATDDNKHYTVSAYTLRPT